MSDAPLDLLGAIAGPYQSITAQPAPAIVLPRNPPPAQAPAPAPFQPAPPAPAPPIPAQAPAPAQPVSWWSVTHPADPAPRTYCGACYHRVPDFLVTSFQRLDEPDGPPAGLHCDGCGTSPDVTGETLEVLDRFIDMVQATDSYPTKDALGDAATIACLEHARDCVTLCAAARGTLDA